MAKQDEILDQIILKIADKMKELRVSAGYSSAENFAYDNELNRLQYWRVESGAN